MALTCVPRAAALALFTVLLCMAAVPASAFVAVPAKFSTTHGLKLNLHATGRRTSARCPPSATSLRMSVTEPPAEWKGNSAKTAGATLKAALATTLDSLKAELSLSEIDAGMSHGAMVSSLEGPDVVWCSVVDADLTEAGGPGVTSLSLWNSPSKSVPHLRAVTSVEAGKVSLSIEFICRAYAAYDVFPDAFPEPTSREMFVQKSVRADMEQLYFTDEAAQWAEGVRTQGGAEAYRGKGALPNPDTHPATKVQISLPLTEEGVAAAVSAREEVVARYLGWMRAAEESGLSNSQLAFAHDCKTRARAAALAKVRFGALFGARDGAEIGMFDAGPEYIANGSDGMAPEDPSDGLESSEDTPVRTQEYWDSLNESV